MEYTIREDWEDYYKTLEAIRRTGTTNMWGAGIYLKECYPNLTEEETEVILLSWIRNYHELDVKYGWQPRGNDNDE